MHQFVQSAIEAAKQGDNDKALAFLKQVLNANPKDIDAWLVLAAVLDDPQRKRQCLNRVLKLDPVNKIAREELMEMDHAEMGGTSPFVSDAFDQEQASLSDQDEPTPTTVSQHAEGYTFTEYAAPPFQAQAQPVSMQGVPQDTLKQHNLQSSSKPLDEKPLVFKVPLWMRILMYFFVIVPGCGGLLIATQNLLGGMFFLGLGLIMLVMVLFFTPKVEVRDSGIRVANAFSGVEVPWDGIAKVKSNAMKRRLELHKKNGDVVKVSTQVSGYPRIVESLRKRRPDLFGSSRTSSMSTSAFESGDVSGISPASTAHAPTFAGDRVFKKSFFKQYGSYLIVIPLCLFAAWTAYAEPQYRVGASISAIFCLVMMILPLFQVNVVKVEQKKLTIESLFEAKEFSAKEIREIKMQTVRGRYGQVTNLVNIIPIKGKNYPLQGFSEGDEIIYGVLTNWWIAHRGV